MDPSHGVGCDNRSKIRVGERWKKEEARMLVGRLYRGLLSLMYEKLILGPRPTTSLDASWPRGLQGPKKGDPKRPPKTTNC